VHRSNNGSSLYGTGNSVGDLEGSVVGSLGGSWTNGLHLSMGGDGTASIGSLGSLPLTGGDPFAAGKPLASFSPFPSSGGVRSTACLCRTCRAVCSPFVSLLPGRCCCTPLQMQPFSGEAHAEPVWTHS
jgi:hypothetical protein